MVIKWVSHIMTKKDAHNVGLNFSNSDTANHVVKTLGETFK